MERHEQELNEYRPMLFSIAYNMLGTISDAEDMVQETFISWLKADKSHVENMKFYLIRTISNKCITHLKKIKQQRETYTGTWLPEPLLSESETDDNPETEDNLSIGFMYLLEKLTPIERGIIILKEAFNIDYPEIAKIFDISYENCRQHFSRARKKLALEKAKFEVDKSEHEHILREFLNACISKNLEGLIELLREDVVVYADSGGVAKFIVNPVSGKEKVVRLLIGGMDKLTYVRMEFLSINGLQGAAFYQDKSRPGVLIAIDTDENKKIRNVYLMANPQKIKFHHEER